LIFSNQEIENAINDFDGVVDDLLNSTHEIYQSNVNRFMNLIQENKVINYVIEIIKTSLLEKPLELSEIEKSDLSGKRLELPSDMNRWIAYVLKIFGETLKGKINMEIYAYQFYHQKNVNESINLFNDQVVYPAMREIKNKLLEIDKLMLGGHNQ